ncbi:IucA/IucC family siderophore biosynthesis protein [Shouchella sp. JSM 1781072]|uniref:IucA/IucC family protein n=1 Tax=Bacillaceae TaxID=186817 RepID=UPI000C07AD62|nr:MULTISPECIES: IucA/IucC family protein [Bacillaceae]UTR08057.1 siderophore biosynthesis protein [Alkalihalobacillus sp. LMS6]
MQQSAKRIAENASLQAFLNSYIRETKKGSILPVSIINQVHHSTLLQSEHFLEMQLPKQQASLRIEIWYESLVGRHTFGTVLKGNADTGWVEQEALFVLITLIQELHFEATYSKSRKSCFDECLVRMLESYHSMCTYLEQRLTANEDIHDPKQSFIEAEQSLLFGHWLHPTPKSRQGMAFWQHAAYAPELRGTFQLYYFYVHHTLIQQESIDEESVWDIVHENVCSELDEKWFPFPMHPLQAYYLRDQPHVKQAMKDGLIQDRGPLGEFFTATSSVRTVFHEKSNWMYKFSIPVKVTNSLRVNKQHELRAGILVAKLIKGGTWQSDTCQFVTDPAYMTVTFPNTQESGFETIIRCNPFKDGGEGVTSIAALVQDPIPGSDSKLAKIIKTLAHSEHKSVGAISEKWFCHYLKNAVMPLISLYDELGIALEAHQQNSLLDLKNDYPKTYYYRDNQGYYLATSYRECLLSQEPELQEAEGLFYEDEEINNRFTYYLFMNQVFGIIHRFGVDGLIEECQLLQILRTRLEQGSQDYTGAGKTFVQHLLTKETLAFKANLLTRFHDVDELAEALEQAVYVKIKNPLLQKNVMEVHYEQTIEAT